MYNNYACPPQIVHLFTKTLNTSDGTQNTLEIPKPKQKLDTGDYVCKASNGDKSTMEFKKIEVLGKFSIKTHR